MNSRPANARTEARTAQFVVFEGAVRILAGSIAEAAGAARRALDGNPAATITIFRRDTAEVVDLDLRGTEQETAARYAEPETSPARRGRPKLGVIAREVTLLPRHWDWLSRQPGGASVTLRKLVEAARRSEAGAARARTDAAYRFMSAMAGDLPGFEEAARALFADERERLAGLIAPWPPDISGEVLRFLDA